MTATEIVFPAIVHSAFSHDDAWLLAGYFHKHAGFKTAVVHEKDDETKIFHFATILPSQKILDINGAKTADEVVSEAQEQYGAEVVIKTIESFDEFLRFTDNLQPMYPHPYPLSVIAVSVIEKYAPSFLPRLKQAS